ncbi:MAG: flavin-containing monooxygenase [Solirubrobacteraceae bacterium]
MRTNTSEHIDVVIIGAGLSGIGAACHLERRCPGRTYAILEARESIGGTWDLFRYPGVRSDSDMHTLGYSFAPWTDDRTIADGPSILGYIQATAEQYGVDDHIRFGHRVAGAAWSSADALWTVTAERGSGGRPVTLTASFVLFCTGYYRYDKGFDPEFDGRERFPGPIVHPQHWPEDLDYTGQRVVIIGSGATAITLVPALAEQAAHVTMLQRSPSYLVSLPGEDPVASRLRRRVPSMAAYQAVRWKNVALMTLSYRLCRRYPQLAKRVLRRWVQSQVPADLDIDTHFKPRYNPWDQRMCVCPDGDFFSALRHGQATIVTDQVDTLTETGIRLRSGQELEADIIVTATGLNLVALGGAEITVDGRELDLPHRLTYKGLMLDATPNAALVIGYTNASWTLKADLTCEYVCRLLNHMSAHGYDTAVAVCDHESMTTLPLLDLDSGYVLRSVDEFPRQGSEPPWRLRQNYPRDIFTLRVGEVDDGVLQFSRRGDGAGALAAPAASEAVPA